MAFDDFNSLAVIGRFGYVRGTMNERQVASDRGSIGAMRIGSRLQ